MNTIIEQSKVVQPPFLDHQPAVKHIDDLIVQVNTNHKQLERYQQLQSSPVQRGLKVIKNGALGIFGYQEKPVDLYMLGSNQQQCVRSLNVILASMIHTYKPDLDHIQVRIDEVLDNAQQHSQDFEDAKETIDSTAEDLKDAYETVSGMSRKSADYYGAIRKALHAEREHATTAFGIAMTQQSCTHDDQHFQTLYFQEHIYRHLLQGVMSMAQKTEQYQQLLDDIFPMWRRIEAISEVTHRLSSGLDSLIMYNKALNEVYSNTVHEMIDCTRNNRHQTIIEQTNVSLAQLLGSMQHVHG